MRRLTAVFLLAGLTWLLAIQPARAETPTPPHASPTPAPTGTPIPSLTPTPNPVDVCFDKSLAACWPGVVREYGVWGAVILVGIGLLIYFGVTPIGKAMQDKITEWVKSWPLFRPAPLPPAEIERREILYLQSQEQSADLQPPDQQMVRLDAYLARLQKREDPLKPSEEKYYVPLEAGLELSPRIGLYCRGTEDDRHSFWRWLKERVFRQIQPVEAGKMFAEQKTFKTIEEAVAAVDEATQAPFPVLALLGEPGAGKSTLLRKLMRDQVRNRLADPSAPLPLFVSLADHRSGSPQAFLRAEWKRALCFDGLDEALAAGRIWLFADGLNEMPRAGYDVRMSRWSAFLREHFSPNGNRALVTCRLADYGDGIGTPRLVIHNMDDRRIFDFLQKRIPERASLLWQQLQKDRDEANGKIYELAQIPFWLVMLARLSGRGGLPRNRAALLDEFIITWLDYENERRSECPGERPLSREQRQAFMDSLTGLAWEGLRRSQNYTFQRQDACRIVRSGQKALTAGEILKLGQDCSLLAVVGENVRFQHQLLQEFFAARKLARRFAAGKNLRAKWRTPWRKWEFVQSRWDRLPDPPQTGWEEAVILAAGMLETGQAEKLALAVLKDTPPLAARCVTETDVAVSPETKRKTKERLQQDLQSPRLRLPARLAAGKALAKTGDPRLLERLHEEKDQNGNTARWIEPDWVDVPEGSFIMGTSPSEHLRLQILHRFQPVSHELPAHEVFTGAFQMGRFPVTVAEYRCFMEAGGYKNDDYWKEAGALRWRNAPLPFEESYAAYQIQLLRENAAGLLMELKRRVDRKVMSPAQANAIRQQLEMQDDAIRKQWEGYEAQKRSGEGCVIQPWGWENSDLVVNNQPVVGVTWYEACAYAAWLSERLGKGIRLPREAEWEKAARFKPVASAQTTARRKQGALWCWGSRWSTNCANTLEGRVMKPTPVGAYPHGASPLGIQDMAGNVWEWCCDWYAKDLYSSRAGQEVKDPPGPGQGNARVLRGGSWSGNRDYARCACRGRSEPDYFLNNFGFRRVRSPSTSDL